MHRGRSLRRRTTHGLMVHVLLESDRRRMFDASVKQCLKVLHVYGNRSVTEICAAGISPAPRGAIA